MSPGPAYRYVPVYPIIRPGSLWPRRADAFWADYPDPRMARFWCFSGRVALYHGLRMLNIRPGSDILMPDYFQGTEMETLKYYGLHLQYYRVNGDLTIDFDHMAAMKTSSCAALYIIHYFGHPHPMERVVEFCRMHKLLLIEDCAVAMLSGYRGRWLGSYGDLAIYSPYKSIGLPHGGLGAVRADEAACPKLERPPFLSTLLQTRDKLGRYLKARAPRPVERGFSTLSGTARHLLGIDRSEQVASGSAAWSPSTLGLDASRLTCRMAQGQSGKPLIRKRQENYSYLAGRLPGHIPILWRSLEEDECPLFLPLLVAQRSRVQKALLERGVESVAVWGDEQYDRDVTPSENVKHLRRSLLEIPVHQDLTRKDLDHLIDVLPSVIAP